MTGRPDIVLEKKGRCGFITFDRDRALNALTYDMIAQMEEHYQTWIRDPDIYGVIMQSTDPRAFCSGGDLKALYEWRQADALETALKLYGTEYQHNWSLERFSKPNVALIDGIVMGGGVGACFYGTHRVVTEKVRFAMPEVAIGFFPDVGATYFLPRFPGKCGLYLGLTGRTVGQADAFYLGFATHCVPANAFDAIRQAMIEAEPIDTVLEGLHRDPGESWLQQNQAAIDRLFSGRSVEEILAALDAESGALADWAKETAAEIRKKSPFSLKVAFRQVEVGADMTLDEALKLEFRIARRFISGDEFYEGIRAAIIDKDNAPRWNPATLDAVGDDRVSAVFAPLEGGELDLVDPFRTDRKAS
ncbi:MAG: enoyl-CoA hydratase/isomerase family protein [Hyphomicrobiales bacterium]|nr:enoyl-CoA hydratase/isomerase family protein [Hyphomicrobiales bacterium]